VIQEVITIFVIATPHLHKGEGGAIPLHCCGLRPNSKKMRLLFNELTLFTRDCFAALAMTEGERDRCGSCPQRQRIKSVIASPTAVGRGNPRVLLRASPELKEYCVFFSTLRCGSRTQRRCVFFSTSSPCSLEIASSSTHLLLR